jgi:hypothetical protein
MLMFEIRRHKPFIDRKTFMYLFCSLVACRSLFIPRLVVHFMDPAQLFLRCPKSDFEPEIRGAMTPNEVNHAHSSNMHCPGSRSSLSSMSHAAEALDEAIGFALGIESSLVMHIHPFKHVDFGGPPALPPIALPA